MYKRFVLLFAITLLSGVASAQEATPIAPSNATAYGTINVRSGPGAQYDIVGQLNADEQVTVDGRESEKGGWLRVTLEGGIIGWVASFAVLLDGDAEDLPIIPSELPTPSGDSVTMSAYGRVNVRSGPGMQYNIVGQFDVDDTAQVTGRSDNNNDWLYIENDSLKGWVAYFTVTIEGNPGNLPVLVVDGTGEGVAAPDEVVVTRFNVRLRDEPKVAGSVLVIVPFKNNVTPLARSADATWVYVLYQDIYGWGSVRLFDISQEKIDALPIYTNQLPTPDPEVTPNPDAEG
ncbi:MAG: SH3 domain-containing protein [Chloroflexota bacterium]